jgi:GTPase
VENPGKMLRELRDQLDMRLAQVKGVACVPLSAKTGRGVSKLLPAVVKSFDRWQTRVSTSRLNRWLQEAVERHPPPMVQNRRIKLRFATQASTRPPTFVFFANKPADALAESYLRYLAQGLRESFDLGGVPLRLKVRHGENPYEPAGRS